MDEFLSHTREKIYKLNKIYKVYFRNKTKFTDKIFKLMKIMNPKYLIKIEFIYEYLKCITGTHG